MPEDQDLQESFRLVSMAQDAHHAVRNRTSMGDIQRSVQPAQPATTCRSVHSSNLCTEITLNTSDSETAVCNLGSINLVAHVKDGTIDVEKLAKTCRTAMRMLDNVVDINYYSVPKARQSNLKHRPVGLGVMGFQDMLLKLRIPYASEAAMEIADYAQEAVSFFAILGSSELAKERGTYSSFKGSLWDKNILPLDSIAILEDARGRLIDMDRSSKLDWTPVRDHIKQYGMRNSNCLAIAPTATISNIIGVSQSIEPTFQNLFVKSNMSGDFTVLNTYLVEDLKALDLWGRSDGSRPQVFRWIGASDRAHSR